jgi:hypothetical protein
VPPFIDGSGSMANVVASEGESHEDEKALVCPDCRSLGYGICLTFERRAYFCAKTRTSAEKRRRAGQTPETLASQALPSLAGGRHWNGRYARWDCRYYGSCYPRRYYRPYYSPYYGYRDYYPRYYRGSGVSIYLQF